MTTDLNTATITRAEGRERIDRLRNAIRAQHAAAFQRGLCAITMNQEHKDAVAMDEAANLRAFAELDIVGDLLLGLIEERTISATALRLITEERAS